MTINFYENELNRSGIAFLSQLLRNFEEGKVELHTLAQRLGTARHGLIYPDGQWLAEYEKYWSAIEDCNALALDAGELSVLDEHKEFLDRTVMQMRIFLDETFPSHSANGS